MAGIKSQNEKTSQNYGKDPKHVISNLTLTNLLSFLSSCLYKREERSVFLTKQHEEKKKQNSMFTVIITRLKTEKELHHSPSPDWKNRLSQYPPVSRHTSQALLVSFFFSHLPPEIPRTEV